MYVCVGSAWKILPVTARSLWSVLGGGGRESPVKHGARGVSMGEEGPGGCIMHRVHTSMNLYDQGSFFQFCDIENLAKFSQHISNISWIYTREKIPVFSQFLVLKITNFVRKKTLCVTKLLMYFLNIFHRKYEIAFDNM